MQRKRFLLVDERTDSIDSLTRVLQLSGYVMLTGRAAKALRAETTPTECWKQPTREHRARELLNGIMLLTRCLTLDGPTKHERRQWRRQITASQMGLKALYARGLDRGFLSASAAS